MIQMSKNKDFNLNTDSINSLVKSLETLSSEIDKMGKKVTYDIAEVGFRNLYNEYANRVKDPNIVDINIGMEPTTNGYRIISQGRDVLYEEFGTGDRGENSPHPDKHKYDLNDYNSGPFILDVADVGNQDMIDVLAQNGITSGKFWSYRKGGKTHLTQGVPAGMEMYRTSKYLKDEGIDKVLKEKASDVLSKV